MADLLEQIAICIERGKVNKNSPYPPDMRGQDGADELVKQALDQGMAPDDVLGKGLVIGMGRVGQKFSENKVFVPDLLMASFSLTQFHYKYLFGLARASQFPDRKTFRLSLPEQQ